jgi:hypothetical protein
LYNALIGLTAGLLLTIAYRITHGAAPNALLPILTGIAVALAGLPSIACSRASSPADSSRSFQAA